MSLKTYLEFSSDPTMWLNDEVISFASCWLLRDQNLTSQFEFIPPIVAKCVCDFVAALNGKKVPTDPVTHLSASAICTIHSYLAHSPTLVRQFYRSQSRPLTFTGDRWMRRILTLLFEKIQQIWQCRNAQTTSQSKIN